LEVGLSGDYRLSTVDYRLGWLACGLSTADYQLSTELACLSTTDCRLGWLYRQPPTFNF